MKSKFIEWLEAAAETMFSELFQAKALIVGAFWNPWQLLFAAMCAAMVLCGISEYKKYSNESKER